MQILPAIDIINGKPVRLKQGDYAQASQVAADALETARQFEADGASFVHMVDLDGAKAGHPVNQDLILKAAKELSIPVEAGGGIRTMDDIKAYLNGGVQRVILSTAALKNPELVKEACSLYPGRIAAGLDCRDGYVAIEGWLETSDVPVLDLAAAMKKAGVKTIIVTDIAKDGMLAGPSVELYKDILKAQPDLELIASGGVSSLDDLKQLKQAGVQGAISGKALYDGRIDLKEAIREVEQC